MRRDFVGSKATGKSSISDYIDSRSDLLILQRCHGRHPLLPESYLWFQHGELNWRIRSTITRNGGYQNHPHSKIFWKSFPKLPSQDRLPSISRGSKPLATFHRKMQREKRPERDLLMINGSMPKSSSLRLPDPLLYFGLTHLPYPRYRLGPFPSEEATKNNRNLNLAINA